MLRLAELQLRADDPELKAAALGELLAVPYGKDSVEIGEAIVKFVPDATYDPALGQNSREAQVVADLVVEHLRTRPERSLGVLACDSAQARLVAAWRAPPFPAAKPVADPGPSHASSPVNTLPCTLVSRR